MRTYDELTQISTLEGRFNYLKIGNGIGDETFGWERYLNQMFYSSKKWKEARREVLIRDGGNELGLDGYPIKGAIYVHHLNEITPEMIENDDPLLYDPKNLISTSDPMHRAIHYGSVSIISNYTDIVRVPNDTCPWKK